MIVILRSSVNSEEQRPTLDALAALPGIEARVHTVRGALKTLTEVYLIGNTKALSAEDIALLPGVDRVVRVSEEYRILGRHSETRCT